MKVKIDQEEVCESCRMDESHCEGSGCEQAMKDYIKDHGLVQDCEKITFTDIDPDDKLYVLVENHMLNIEVSGVTKESDRTTIMFAGSGIDKVCVKPNQSEAEDNGVLVFVNKNTALTKYKQRMSETIIHMAETIASFSTSEG